MFYLVVVVVSRASLTRLRWLATVQLADGNLRSFLLDPSSLNPDFTAD